MKITYMYEFVTLAENLSYKKAASELNLAQSVLSRHINSVENELGVKLLFRSSHEIVLTPEGEIACREFRNIVDIYKNKLEPLMTQKHE